MTDGRFSRLITSVAVLISCTGLTWAPAAGNKLIIDDGYGDKAVVKHGWFGGRETSIQDRLGDKVQSKKGVFGQKDQEIDILGNRFHRKKGWFGSSTIEGSSILGDKISTKKGIFGWRTTTVNVSGITSLIHSFMADRAPSTSAPGPGSKLQSKGESSPVGAGAKASSHPDGLPDQLP